MPAYATVHPEWPMMYRQEDNLQASPRRGRHLGAALALSLGVHLLALWLPETEPPAPPAMPGLSISLQHPAITGSAPADHAPAPVAPREPEHTRPADNAIGTTVPEPKHRVTQTQKLKQQPETVAEQHSESQPETGESRAGDAPIDRAAVENRVMEALQARFSYPALARRRGWEGRVLLRLDLDATGHIDRVAIEHSSGYRVLDRAALEALRNLVGEGPLAEGITQPLEGLRIPVVYRLQG